MASEAGERQTRASAGRPIAPATTTVDDVRWAYRVLLGQEPKDENAERVSRAKRSLLDLYRHMVGIPEFRDERRRRRRSEKRLDGDLVRWAYRLMRFEEIDELSAQSIAAERESLGVLVDELFDLEESVDLRARAAPGSRSSVLMLYGKSMPRSGHHLLANLLGEYYGRAFAYCEFYSSEIDCCHSIPCFRPFHPLLENEIFLQKSHDFGFMDRRDLTGRYIVQYRHPIPRLQSNYDHSVAIDGGQDSWERFVTFAEAETTYFIRFWRKWIHEAPPRAVIVTYEDLVSRPTETLERVIRSISGDASVDGRALERALMVMSRRSGSSSGSGEDIAIRDSRQFRYFDVGLLTRLEERTFAACPGLPFARMFP